MKIFLILTVISIYCFILCYGMIHETAYEDEKLDEFYKMLEERSENSK